MKLLDPVGTTGKKISQRFAQEWTARATAGTLHGQIKKRQRKYHE